MINELHALKISRNMTYRDISDALLHDVGMGSYHTPNTISKWFNGYHIPDLNVIDDLATILEYDPEKLRELFCQAYKEKHQVRGQMSIDDISQSTTNYESEIGDYIGKVYRVGKKVVVVLDRSKKEKNK